MARDPNQASKYSPLPVDAMPILDLLSVMGEAIAGDRDLATWCDATYNRAQITVFSGTDPENPPSESSYPLVELFPLSGNGGVEIDRHQRTIGIVCGVHDPDPELAVYNGLSLQRGVLKLDELWRQVLALVSAADLRGGYVSAVEIHYDQETAFPFFLLGAELTVVNPG